MAKIRLTPSELLIQGNEMAALKSEYETFFSQVLSILNETNNNWSSVLANNFAGKIESAQRSFSGVVEVLNWGAQAAKQSATTMENVDSHLASLMQSVSSASGVGSSGAYSGGFWTGVTTPAGKYAKEISERYDELPEYQKKLIEKIVDTVGGEDTAGILEVALEICAERPEDLLALDVDPDIIKHIAGLTTFTKGMGYLGGNFASEVIKESYNVAVNPSGNMAELMRGVEYLQESACEKGRNGDIIGGLGDVFKATSMYAYTLVYGTLEVGSEALAGTLEDVIKLPVSIAQLGSDVLSTSPDSDVGQFGESIDWACDKEETGMGLISDWLQGLF